MNFVTLKNYIREWQKTYGAFEYRIGQDATTLKLTLVYRAIDPPVNVEIDVPKEMDVATKKERLDHIELHLKQWFNKNKKTKSPER